MKLFLDANVLFTAAHNPKGKAAFVIISGEFGKWKVHTCALAIEEADRNLRIKFPAVLPELKRLLHNILVVPTVIEGHCKIHLPEKDRPIFLSAVASQCTHLLTGDLKDFGPHMNQPKKTEGIVIQTVSQFLEKV